MRKQLLCWSIVAFGASFGFGACAGGNDDNGDLQGTDGGIDGSDNDGFVLGDGADSDFVSVAIDPKTSTLTVDEAIPATAKFALVGTRADGSTATITDGVTWSVDAPAIGAIDKGIFTANATLGGVVGIKAQIKSKSASATLTVKLKTKYDAATADDATKDALRKATAADASVQWAYPYDDTVFPRGLAGPTLMWNGGAGSDDYRVSLTSPTFEFEGFIKVAIPARYDLPEKVWNAFVESTSGAATLTVSRFAGGKATKVTELHWTVAPGSMRGTIYYWSNREGRVLRIKPGAAKAEDFTAGILPTSDTLSDGTTSTPVGCTMTCHSVSADGSTLISGGDIFGGSWDLAANKAKHSFPEATFSARRQWNFASVSPEGKYVVLHGNGTGGLYSAADGTAFPASGLESIPTWFPQFSPTGKQLFYIDFAGGPTTNNLMAFDFDPATGKFGGKKVLVDAAAVPTQKYLAFPTGTPDGKFVAYMRATLNSDTRGNCLPGKPACEYDNRADLYLAPADAKGAEVALNKLNGTGYPFAAGTRDLSWNFEPTMAPVAAGGYYWIVFTSRRTYGNAYQGTLAEPPQVKQLWVAAIDTTVTPGKDPSHAAFRLPGQSLTFVDGGGTTQNALNMRGFWALEPCKSDGTTCMSGSDCCGGFCEKKAGDEAGSCKSAPPPCSSEGDKCKSDDDCCGKADGAKCLGGFCSQKPPS
jgi:hypothetical protein